MWTYEDLARFRAGRERVEAEMEDRRNAQLEQLRRQAADRRWASCGVFDRHRNRLADKELVWPAPAKVSACADVLDRGSLLILVGPRGTGKTQLAAMFAKEFIYDLEETAVYWRFSEFCQAIYRAFSGVAPDPRPPAREAGLLILDEVHEQGGTQGRELTAIVDDRYGREKPTILITNANVAELPAMLGDSAWDRAREGGKVIVCDWPGFRGAS